MATQISIVIPIYNAAATLRAAVESVLAQDVPDMELLLVDDGSTDATAVLCHALSEQDRRVRVLTQKNAGICAARNRGIEAAAGEYIAFCDDDDEFLPGALPLLLEAARKTGADVVRADYELLRERADGSFQEQQHPCGESCRLWKDGYEAFLQNCGPQFVWNALYRRAALKGLKFDERCRYGLEDFIFNMMLYAATDRAVYLPQVVYRHFERRQSTSVCRSAQAFQGRIQALGPWMAAEYAALQARCTAQVQERVWTLRRTEAVTFLMHQLRDGRAPAALRRRAWRTLRAVLARYPGSPLDFLRIAGQNKKKTAALLLYQLHMQRMYDVLSGQ